MKKVLLTIFAVLILASCGVQQRVVSVSFVDYRKYESEGFFISPYAYTGKYESIGELNITVVPGVENVREQDMLGVYSQVETYKEEISREELTDIAVSNAKEKGADAIVNFSVKFNGYLYEVSGYCIKRK